MKVYYIDILLIQKFFSYFDVSMEQFFFSKACFRIISVSILVQAYFFESIHAAAVILSPTTNYQVHFFV